MNCKSLDYFHVDFLSRGLHNGDKIFRSDAVSLPLKEFIDSHTLNYFQQYYFSGTSDKGDKLKYFEEMD